ncbi:hypothetical protein CAPI_00895 [Corynebacterium capitovis DSM 44611]|uniref:hypothetical protein n=1 Tax=Corynebacterium capitovis TaxID=131081 RepID=UPI0003739015|nr:hypothetical protein [Corynebacterium capitovis]WKD56757.1 hypothetical protein CAPI_00895 [Corynebacterium capitovis DSM 44611]
MGNSNHIVADIRSESFPNYEARIEDAYVEGYDPVSLGAPHSSLQTYSLWIGMGLILSALFGIGLAVWGGAAHFYGSGSQVDLSNRLFVLGLAEAIITLAVGALLISRSRRAYKEYRTRTGRIN